MLFKRLVVEEWLKLATKMEDNASLMKHIGKSKAKCMSKDGVQTLANV